MNWHNSTRLRRDMTLDHRRIQYEVVRLDICEHWPGADVQSAIGRGHEAERRGDDLVARADVVGQHSDMERARAGRGCDGVLDATHSRKAFFKLVHTRALGQL